MGQLGGGAREGGGVSGRGEKKVGLRGSSNVIGSLSQQKNRHMSRSHQQIDESARRLWDQLTDTRSGRGLSVYVQVQLPGFWAKCGPPLSWLWLWATLG